MLIRPGIRKTTINCVAGLIKPTYAKIKINSVTLNNTEDNYFALFIKNIGYVFQTHVCFLILML